MLFLPLTHFLADILAPILGMEHGKAVASVQLGPRTLRLPLLEDMGIWRKGLHEKEKIRAQRS